MTAKITDTETQITAQRERARELYAGAGNLDGLKSDIATLTDQVATLEQSLHDLRQAGALGEGTSGEGTTGEETTGEGTPDEGTPGDPASLTSASQVKIERFRELSQKYTAFMAAQMAPLPQITVYFQFAGVSRKVAEDISNRLKLHNCEVPGEERIGSAAGKKEVRFF